MEDRVMLVLSRKAGESIQIDGQIKITIVTVSGNRVKVGIEAPEEVQILRSELRDSRENTEDSDVELDSISRKNPFLCCC
jgi:carbon storage regulator